MDFPFAVKKKVMQCALLSSLFYSCEAWINNSVRLIEVGHRSMVKELLGVRTSTPNDVCLVEAGMCSAEAKVKDIQREFMLVWNLCKNANTEGHQYLTEIMDSENDYCIKDKLSREKRIRDSPNLKSVLYLACNPNLTVHEIYKDIYVHEYQEN